MNTFINLVKKTLIEEEKKGRIRASKEVKALIKASLLSPLDFLIGSWLTSLSYSQISWLKGWYKSSNKYKIFEPL